MISLQVSEEIVKPHFSLLSPLVCEVLVTQKENFQHNRRLYIAVEVTEVAGGENVCKAWK